MALQHFDNEFITIDIGDEPGCLLKFEVIASPKTVEQAHIKALSAVRKEVSLPGFRKGRLPDSLLNTHFEKAIEQEWKDHLLNFSFQKALELTDKKPIKASADKIKSKIKSFKGHNESAELSFEFECFPSVPTFEITDLNLIIPEAKTVLDLDVEDVITTALHSASTWEEISDRPAEKGDFIRLDMFQLNEENTPVFSDRRLVITDKKMAPWLMSIVIGLKTGESLECGSVPSESLEKSTIDPELQSLFKPIPYRVTLKAIEKPVLPELDAEFAKKLGAADLDSMRAAMLKQLQAQKDYDHRNAVIEVIENTLFEKYIFDLPASLVTKDTISFENSKTQVLRIQGNLTEDEINEHKQLIHDLSLNESRKRLALYYLFNDFNLRHQIIVSNDDLNKKLSQLISHVPEEMISQVIKSLTEDFYGAILSETIIEKGLDYIAAKILAA